MHRAVLAAAVTSLLVAGACGAERREAPASILLLDRYAQAEKRSNLSLDEAFALVDVTIGGEERAAIFMHPTSRLIFSGIDLPHDAWLRTWIALRPEVWERETGDGALFRFGIADGRTYDDLVREYVDPRNQPGDRRWIPVEVDLSPYGGLVVDLIFNTESTVPGGTDEPTNDWAVWGAPEIVVMAP
jgi:hypothetical protein